MPDTATETPQRTRYTSRDVIEAYKRAVDNQHEERMATIAKPGREDRPRFTLKRSTASGSLGVIAIDVDVPVCEEYPTAELAFEAARRFMDDFCAAYPLPSGDVRAK